MEKDDIIEQKGEKIIDDKTKRLLEKIGYAWVRNRDNNLSNQPNEILPRFCLDIYEDDYITLEMWIGTSINVPNIIYTTREDTENWSENPSLIHKNTKGNFAQVMVSDRVLRKTSNCGGGWRNKFNVWDREWETLEELHNLLDEIREFVEQTPCRPKVD